MPMTTLTADHTACANASTEEELKLYGEATNKDLEDSPLPPPGRSLITMLFDAGFDVWWDGNRGTLYNRETTDGTTTEDAEYWDFSAKDMGVEDQPAAIEYILSVTGKAMLSYIGYSMGSTQMFYALGMAAEEGNEALKTTL